MKLSSSSGDDSCSPVALNIPQNICGVVDKTKLFYDRICDAFFAVFLVYVCVLSVYVFCRMTHFLP